MQAVVAPSGIAPPHRTQWPNSWWFGVAQSIVQTCISNGLPRDRSGAYFVISSADVAQGTFCRSYCGWHDDQDGL